MRGIVAPQFDTFDLYKYLGKVGYLPKLHKLKSRVSNADALMFRRIEADTANPLYELAGWVAALLVICVRKYCSTCTPDAKYVVSQLEPQKILADDENRST